MRRILIAIKNDIIREGLKQIVERCPDLILSGEVVRFSEAVKNIEDDRCDAIMLNLLAPYTQTLDAVRYVKHHFPYICVIVFSRFSERELALRMIKNGVDCYLTIDHSAEKIIESINKVLTGKKHITTTYVEQLIYDANKNRVRLPHENLSDREYQVFLLIAAGKGINEIGSSLNLSPKTISTYRARIMEKLRIHNNADCTFYAVRHNLIATTAE